MQTHQLLVDTLVQLPLGGAALPQLLVVVFETLPVIPERLEAGLVDVLQPRETKPSVSGPMQRTDPPRPFVPLP